MSKKSKIFYFHVLNHEIKTCLNYIYSKYSVLDLNDLVEQNPDPGICSVIADDSHISCLELIESKQYPKVHFGLIGSRSLIDLKKDKKSIPDLSELPDPNLNLQSAHYHAILGDNQYFLEYYEDMQGKVNPKRIINHTWSHSRYFVGNEQIGTFDVKDPCNWWVAKYHQYSKPADFPIFESEFLHLSNSHMLEEILNVKIFEFNPNFIIAPWNVTNREF